ncbi:MAG TPA: hypothetical protein VG345_16655 [Bryobacteraceae bacterium]|jgi:hypothetical protein|nr:hypothetical protein [Bryobacteraceae bacterium]
MTTKGSKTDLNQGGHIQGKVISVSRNSFTILIDAPGHEHHEKEIEVPAAYWNGPGAVVGAEDHPELDDRDPRATPKVGNHVLLDADAYDKKTKSAHSGKD